MKDSLKAGLEATKTYTVDESRCIGFMGKEAAVYATPRMVNDVEYTCRDMLLEHLDAGEDSVGAHVSIDHLAPTPMGLEVTVEVRIAEVDRRKVVWEFTVRDPAEEIGRGRHVRFVVENAKTRERLAAKRARLGSEPSFENPELGL
jgi:fluoroacetyl-CoA thioesterase